MAGLERIEMDASATSDWRIEFPGGTREGFMGYYEGARAISFFWEFGGTDVVMIIYAGTLHEWSKLYPWAVDRQLEILQRVAEEVIRQHAPSCKAEIETRKDGHTLLLIREKEKRPSLQDGYERARARYIADGSLVVSDAADDSLPASDERRQNPFSRLMTGIKGFFK